jgi:hypothetical protein
VVPRGSGPCFLRLRFVLHHTTTDPCVIHEPLPSSAVHITRYIKSPRRDAGLRGSSQGPRDLELADAAIDINFYAGHVRGVLRS